MIQIQHLTAVGKHLASNEKCCKIGNRHEKTCISTSIGKSLYKLNNQPTLHWKKISITEDDDSL